MSARRTIATNIRETVTARIAIAKVGRQRQEKSFSLDTPLRDINAWLERTRGEFRKRRRALQRQRGTLAGDVRAYIATLPKGRSTADTSSNLAAWVLAIGDVKRSTLTTERLQAVITTWIEAGVAANTIKHRRRALAQLVDYFDGAEGNLVRALKAPAEPEPEARAVDMQLLDAIIGTMDAQRSERHPGRGGSGFRNKTQARLRLLLWTGISPATMRKLKPHAIDLDQQTITLPPRRKGKGAKAVTLPLFPQGVDACRHWLRAFAWGTFDARALGRSFHAAVRRYVRQEAEQGRTITVPPDLRVYDLRHSFLTWLAVETGDPILVQHFAQHASLTTTSRYIRGAVDPRARAAVERIRKRTDSAVGSQGQKSA